MKIILFLTVALVTEPILGVIFPGPCPGSLPNVDYNFQCSENITSGAFRVVAYLPVAGNTLNIFYNPFESIDCLDFGLTCSYAYSRNIQIRYNCYPTMTGNKTDGIVTQCVPLTFDPRRLTSNQIST